MTRGVVGSRSFEDLERFGREIDALTADQSIECFVSGGADGADALAERYASLRLIPMVVHEAQWERYGAKAGPKRNRLIVEDSDVLVAFWDGLSTGTWNSIERAQKLGKTVHILDVSD